ncbi:hypothetical protein EDD16DRAFT_1853446 [Pisolithus croceorrhizus]|nr:hypothetical protein EDD16DRAFT_1853446 [Pisolithus croceorrhizus]
MDGKQLLAVVVGSTSTMASHPSPTRGGLVWAYLSAKLWLRTSITALIVWTLYYCVQFSYSAQEPEAHVGQDIFQGYSQNVGKDCKDLLCGREAETLFLSIPNEESALATSRLFASEPHMAGTSGDFETAKSFLAILQDELGVKPLPGNLPIFRAGTRESRSATLNIPSYTKPMAWVDTYFPILNTPLNHSLEILGMHGNPVWTADLEEISDETDPYAAMYATATPAWHALSRGGEALGKLVNAHYGRKQDYDALLEAGVNFTGKIVLARYGSNFRGLKVKRAQELGAAGVLIYSDPRDDGTVTPKNGYKPYPHGPARNPTSVQRGNVHFPSLYPGDPTTPGYPSYEESVRMEGLSRPTIPSLPISWKNAEILLKWLNGTEEFVVRLVNNVDEKITPIWNVIGVIPGHISDEVVVVGGHRDEFIKVLGASDPSSGTTSMLEAVRGFGELLRDGWRPLRSIVVASWDAEEFGLIGSTEWGEDFTEWIRDHVVAYVNIDTSVSGSRLRTSASPLLAHLLMQTAKQIPHPTSEGRTLWDARTDNGTLFGDDIDKEVLNMDYATNLFEDNLGIRPLGSGSDYTVFLQYIGVPSAEACFTSTLHDPVYHYHSVFDTQRWQELYGDPTFSRHVAIAKHLGLQALRLSGDLILPLNTTHYSLQLKAYFDRVVTLAAAASIDVDFSPLRDSIYSLQAASLDLDAEKAEAEHKTRAALKFLKRHGQYCRTTRRTRVIFCELWKLIGKVFHPEDSVLLFEPETGLQERRLLKALEPVRLVNGKLIAFERAFISKDGIKGREWFKHLGVAPGKWLGYGATILPGITEAITFDGDPVAVAHEIERLRGAIDNLVEKIRVHT